MREPLFTTEKKMSIKQVQDEAREKMQSSLNSLKNELIKVRSGRAHAGLFDQIQIDYYGNIRRDANNRLKDLLKGKTISEDDERRAASSVQELTNLNISEAEKIFSVKETDLLSV